MFQINHIVRLCRSLSIALVLIVCFSDVSQAEEVSAPSQSTQSHLESSSTSGVADQAALVYYTQYMETTKNYGFNFYAGIVIVAALLLYVMLRRLPPEKEPASGNPPNELR